VGRNRMLLSWRRSPSASWGEAAIVLVFPAGGADPLPMAAELLLSCELQAPEPAPQPENRYARDDDCKGDTRVTRIRDQCVEHHVQRGDQEYRWNDRIAPHAVRTRQLGTPRAQQKHGGYGERVEGPDAEDEFVGELSEVVLQHIRGTEHGGEPDRDRGAIEAWRDARRGAK